MNVLDLSDIEPRKSTNWYYVEPEKSTKLQHEERERSKKWYYVEPERSNDGSDLGAD